MQRRISEIQKEKECTEDEAIIQFNQEQRREGEEKWANYMKSKEPMPEREKEKLLRLEKRFGMK